MAMARGTKRWAGLLGAALVLAAAGAAWGQAAALDGPAMARVFDRVPQDATLVVVIKDQAAADAKLDELVGMFMPPPAGPGGPDQPAAPAKPKMELIKKLQKGMMGSSELVKPHSPLVFVVNFRSDPPGAEPLAAALVDVTDFKALVGDAKADENGVYQLNGRVGVAQYGDLVLVGEHPESVVFFKKMAPGVKLASGQRELWNGSDAFVTVNLAAMVKTYTPFYEKYHAEMLKAAREGAADNVPSGEAAPDSAVSADPAHEKVRAIVAKNAANQAKLIEPLWDLANQADWLAVGAGLDGGSVDLRMAFAAKPGTKLASYLEDHPPLGAKLSPDLPQADCWMAAWYSFNPDKVGEAVNDMVGFLNQLANGLGAGRSGPEMAEQGRVLFSKLPPLVKAWTKLIGGKGAVVAMTDSKGGLFNMLAVQEIKDVVGYRAQMEESAKTFNELIKSIQAVVPQEENRIMPKIGLVYDKDVQKAGDLSLDRLSLTIDVPEKEKAAPGGPDPGAMLKNLMGGDKFTMWLALSDGYACMQSGPNPDRIAEIVKTAKEGGGLADDPAIVALRRHTLPEANVVKFVSLSTYANFMFWNVMSAMSGMPMPPVDPAAAKSKSATSLAAGHGRVAVELYLPQSEVKQLATTIMGFVQMAQQQAQQQMQRQMQQMQPPGELQKEKPAAPQEQKKPAASDVGQITTDPPADELCPETPDAPEDQ